jgi:pre-mRNA-processing factor SLU7
MVKEKVKEKKANKDGFSSDSDDDSVKDKNDGQNHNLRIREDTAKYLRNLDPNSAPYDPKSRSMKSNPNPTLPESDQDYKGDNFIKISGDYLSLIKNEGFMLEVNKHGLTANTLGMPSQFEIL